MHHWEDSAIHSLRGHPVVLGGNVHKCRGLNFPAPLHLCVSQPGEDPVTELCETCPRCLFAAFPKLT